MNAAVVQAFDRPPRYTTFADPIAAEREKLVSVSAAGTFAERALAASWMCLPLPETLDDVTAAGIANPAMSSWAALTARAKFVPGESVLILGATGVAGQHAVQVAKRLGD